MEHGATLIAVIHIIIAFLIVVVVLLQDSKGGGMGGAFGGGSNQSIFGASGSASFLVRVTRYLAFGFGVTCVLLTVLAARHGSKSVIDALPVTSAPPVTSPATGLPTGPVPPAPSK